MKCPLCQALKIELRYQSPVGWLPFGPGPSFEEPLHFYVFTESTAPCPAEGS